MHAHRRTYHRAAGFTLVELILTMTIIGIISVVAVTSFEMPTYDIEMVARQVEGGINYARFTAITEQNDCGVIAVSTTSFRVYCGTTSSAVTNPQTRSDWLTSFATDFPEAAFNGTPQIEFNASGVMTTGTNPIFTLEQGSSKIEIFVETTTGHTCLDRDDTGNC